MTVGAVLLVYAVLLGGFGPLAGRSERWLVRAPRLGAILLLAAAWSMLAALFLAGLTVAVPGTVLSSGLSHVLGACILRLRAAYVTPGGIVVGAGGIALSVLIVARTAWAAMQVTRDRRAESRRQRSLVSLCGQPNPELAAIVIAHVEPAAYCLPGRANTVIVTRGTLDLLTPTQLAAVLAHERAHLDARHHRLLGSAALAARVLPVLPFMRALPARVRSLLEMHADDLAAQVHDPQDLAEALVAMATSRTGRASRRSHAVLLAVAEHDTASRIRRLLLPPARLTPQRRRTVRAVVAALSAIPLVLALTPAAIAASQPPVLRAATAVAGSLAGSPHHAGPRPGPQSPRRAPHFPS